MAESPISKCKSCGLEGHLRKSSKLCPNHNMTPESTEIVPNPSVNTKSTPICAACGGTGHRRSSHTDCPRNRVNLASETLPSNGTNHDPVDKKAKVQNSAATPSSVSQLETKPASTTAPDSDSASTPVTALTNVKCATCGENGHRRMSHRDCPKNPQNIARRQQLENDSTEAETDTADTADSIKNKKTGPSYVKATTTKEPHDIESLTPEQLANNTITPETRPSGTAIICASCGEAGHQRKSHKDCKLNKRISNRSESPQTSPNTHVVTTSNNSESDDATVFDSSAICVSCGLVGHRRKSNKACPMNTKRLSQSENPIPEQSTATCSSCGEVGHRRKSYRNCPMNSKAEIRVETVRNNTATTNPAKVCASCGNPGHRRKSHADCPNNPSRPVGPVGPANSAIANKTSTMTCVSCGEIGHRRKSNKACKLNHKRPLGVENDSSATGSASTASVINDTAEKCATCGETGHRRKSHIACKFNPRRPQLSESSMTTKVVETDNSVSSESSASEPSVSGSEEKCFSCGEIGHRRKSHKDCKLNSKRLQSQEPDSAAKHSTGQNLNEGSSVEKCISCGELGHQRKSNKACKLNPKRALNPVPEAVVDSPTDKASMETTEICVSCGEPGHRRKSHRGCRLNPKRLKT